MIDRTNERIGQLQAEIERENERRYTFQRMLRATDRMLWRLEEMNRDGIRTVPETLRQEIADTAAGLPPPVRGVHRQLRDVQAALDNLFEIQESLFRWRHPDWRSDEDEGVERAS